MEDKNVCPTHLPSLYEACSILPFPKMVASVCIPFYMLSNLIIQLYIALGRGTPGYSKGKGRKASWCWAVLSWGESWETQNEEGLPWGWLGQHHLRTASGNCPRIHAPFASELFPQGLSCLLPSTEHHSGLFLILVQRRVHPNSAFQWKQSVLKAELPHWGLLDLTGQLTNENPICWCRCGKKGSFPRGKAELGSIEALEQLISISLQ